DRTRVITWLQSTQIGLDAFVDNEELIGFATELKTGKPLVGVDLSIYPNGAAVSQVEPQQEPGVLQRGWNWLTGWGSDQANDIQAFETDGTVVSSEEISEATSNLTPVNGILRLPLPNNSSPKGQNVLVARRGKDVAFLPENPDYYWQDSGTWYRKTASDSLRWFVFDDRGIYKPKEEVTAKGYIRNITGGQFGDVESLGGRG